MSVLNIEIAEFLVHAKEKNKTLFESKFPDMDYGKVVVEPGICKSESESIEKTHRDIYSLFRSREPWNIGLELLKGSFVLLKQAEGLMENNQSISDDFIPYIEHFFRLTEVPYYHPLYHELGERKFIASIGGKARSQTYDPAKQEAARLLLECKPANGWVSIAQAINEVDGKLYEFIKAQGIPLKQSALPETLRRWLRKDTALRSALEETLSTEARRRIGL
ncbi:hypothetical protein [Stutzerimonas stutzeri]|jgi:hypothetical protein|uniref:hypothetical protein n=1 Tax=Stutzerimonas stutzeri TaxID=316 RepID=UPI00300E8BC9